MGLFDGIELADTAPLNAVRAYLEAQAAKDFSDPGFFAPDVVFDGAVLRVEGRPQVAGAMQEFIQSAIEHIRIEAIRDLGDGRVLALYWFKLAPAPSEQMLCDHITTKDGQITRVENVFDASTFPPMP